MDDNPRDAQGVRDALLSVTGISHFRVVTGPREAVAYLRNESPFSDAPPPDVIVLVVNPPTYQGRDALAQIRRIDMHPPVVILADPGNGPASRYLGAGAADYVVREDLSQLTKSVIAVLATRAGLQKVTPRQIQVLRLIAGGLSTIEIGGRLRISAKTVEAHRSELMRRLGVDTVAGLVHFAIRMFVVEPGRP